MPDIQNTLMEYRLKTAKEKLHSAEILLASGQYKDSVGRSYYIKTEILPRKYSKFISTAFQIRNNCDYADFFQFIV